MMKAWIRTWKMGTDRYLHEIWTSGVWFYVITNFCRYSPNSLTLRNKILAKRSTKEVQGFKEVRYFNNEVKFSNTEWALLCFGGNDNMELRKKAYGEESEEITVTMKIWSSGRVDYIGQDSEPTVNILSCHYVYLAKDMNKRLGKNPLSRIIYKRVPILGGDEPKHYQFTVPVYSWIQLLKRVKEWFR